MRGEVATQRSNKIIVVSFATSNAHKVREAANVLSEFGIEVEQLQGKGAEIQADDLSSVAISAAREASQRYRKAVIVEDAGLFVDELNGFPGPYSSYVYRSVGLDKFLKMLATLNSRSATFKSSVSYCEPGLVPLVFEGACSGRITFRASGSNGFGFDPVFVPAGYDSTFAEMTHEQKNKISHRGDSMRKFATWFLKKTERV